MAPVAFVTPASPLAAWPSTRSVAAAARPTTGAAALRATAAPTPPTKTPMSRSMPFLTRPPALDGGLPGDVGFDPLGFSTRVGARWLREAELKHGRVAGLAVVGMLVQEGVHLPNALYANPLPAGAWADVPSLALWQVLAFCGLFEMATYGGNINYPMMMEFFDAHPERVGGTFGCDVMGLLGGDTAKTDKAARLRLSELKNGRLAMLAAGGMITQSVMFDTPILNQLLHFQPMVVPGL